MYIKKHIVKLIWILVCYNIRASQCNKDVIRKHTDLINDRTHKEEQTTSIPSKVESRFFDLGGVINQLFPGFNQGGGAVENPGLNLPSNSQFYPGVSAQNWYPQKPINQGNGWFPNEQLTPPQNQRLPPNGNFNQQGTINNNFNEPQRYFNQGNLGQYPGHSNGNPINSGLNQNGFQYPGLQQDQSYQLGGQQIPSDNQYQGQLTHPDQAMSNFNNNRPNIGNGINYPPQQVPSSGQGQSMILNPNRPNTFNNNQFPIINQNTQYPNNQASNKQQQNQNNWNQQGRYPNGEFLNNGGINYPPGQGTPSEQQDPRVSYAGQNNKPLFNTNSNLNQNFNNLGANMNNENSKPNIQIPEFNNDPRGTAFPSQETNIQGQEVDANGAIHFPNDSDYDTNENIMAAVSPTTMISPINTESPSNKNAIVGKPVFIPTTTIPSSHVTFQDSDITTASQKECVQNCPTSSEYNPICGTDGVSYFNPGRLLCARNCGINVFEARQGSC